jgi:MHS family proline/betaine transporter-like MFS transporter
MSHATISGSGRKPVSGTRAVVAVAIANMLEWYDFIIYAFFAVYIAQNFFPSDDPSVDLLKAFLAFGLGFVIRPLGAIVIGIYGDRAGRKAALVLTIMTMAAGTLLIAVAPSYAAIGIGAPLMLVAGRVLQGFSAGGEIGGAAAFLVEHAPPNKKGIFASWLQASMGMSNILAALVAFSVTTFIPVEAVTAWGWRIPFVIGLLIAPVGLFLLRTLEETPHFKAELERRARETHAGKPPLVGVFQDHWRSLLIGLGFSILWAVCVYALIIFAPVYVQTAFGFTASQSFSASLIGNIVLVAGCFVSGALSDSLGRRTMLGLGASVMFVAVLPLFMWLQASPTTMTLVLVQSAFCLMVAIFVGVAPAALSEIFPVGVRSTGMSIVYNTAVTIFGGFAPAILTWFTQVSGGSVFAPAWYVMAAAALALFSIMYLPGRAAQRAAYRAAA